MSKQNIEYRSIEELVPYLRNSRKHGDDIAGLAEGILEFGFTNPILIDKDGIIAGHGRVEAVKRIYKQGKQIKLPNGNPIPKGTIPTLDCTGWSETKRKAYIIWDNRSAEKSSWDIETLNLELEEIKLDGDFNIDMTGWDDGSLSALEKKSSLFSELNSSGLNGGGLNTGVTEDFMPNEKTPLTFILTQEEFSLWEMKKGDRSDKKFLMELLND